MPIPRKMLIRADASATVGSGHVMRMVALAQAWIRRGNSVVLATQECSPTMKARLACEQIAVIELAVQGTLTDDADATRSLAETMFADCVVLDGYHFDANYQLKLFSNDRTMLVVDDCLHADRYHCDFILNQNLGAVARDYESRANGADILAGTRFALLRQEFLKHSNWQRDATRAKRLLVTMGGSDPLNVTEKILTALLTVSDLGLTVRVIGGDNNPNFDRLQELAQHLPLVRLLRHVRDMSQQYRWADVAISAGGSTNWEMSLFGLPRAVVVLAENQRGVASELNDFGAAENLGDGRKLTIEDISNAVRRLVTDTNLRRNQLRRSLQLVDGKGADRVVNALLRHCLQTTTKCFRDSELTLRAAQIADAELLLDWRNDPLTRAGSLQQTSVSRDEHQSWLTETINGKNRRLWIAQSEQSPIGTVRFDFNDEIELSWTIAPKERGKGWGTKLVQCAVQFANCDLVALIRRENEASQKIARRNGFHLEGKSEDMLVFRRS